MHQALTGLTADPLVAVIDTTLLERAFLALLPSVAGLDATRRVASHSDSSDRGTGCTPQAACSCDKGNTALQPDDVGSVLYSRRTKQCCTGPEMCLCC